MLRRIMFAVASLAILAAAAIAGTANWPHG